MASYLTIIMTVHSAAGTPGTACFYVDFHAISICGTHNTPESTKPLFLLCLPRSHGFKAEQSECNKPGKRRQLRNRFAQELDPERGGKET